MSKWGMVIDLKKCVGCYACVIACKQDHFVPPDIFLTKILVNEEGEYPNARKVFFPTICNHCENAACVKVCPTGASIKRDDGIVYIDADKCVGCQHCILACPYNQRYYYEGDQAEYFPGQGKTELEKIGELLDPKQPGTVMKCTFCMDKIEAGLAKGLTPGVDHEATPACTGVCMCHARVFGDLDDPESNVSKLIKERNGVTFHPEFGTEPLVYYVE